jgi:hypothetical protein
MQKLGCSMSREMNTFNEDLLREATCSIDPLWSSTTTHLLLDDPRTKIHNAVFYNLLSAAKESGDYSLLEKLIKHPNFNPNGVFSLTGELAIVFHGHQSQHILLMKEFTPLLWACVENDIKSAALLLQNPDIDLDAKYKQANGLTLRELAEKLKHTEIVKLIDKAQLPDECSSAAPVPFSLANTIATAFGFVNSWGAKKVAEVGQASPGEIIESCAQLNFDDGEWVGLLPPPARNKTEKLKMD